MNKVFIKSQLKISVFLVALILVSSSSFAAVSTTTIKNYDITGLAITNQSGTGLFMDYFGSFNFLSNLFSINASTRQINFSNSIYVNGSVNATSIFVNGATIVSDNTSWNKSYADTLYAATGVTSGIQNITTGTGLNGGFITTNGTISLTDSGVIAGSYGSSTIYPIFTVDAQGRLTSVTNTSLPTASTSTSGIVQLSDSVTSTSTTLAATANAVKTAYDLANGKVSGTGTDGKIAKWNSTGLTDSILSELGTTLTTNGNHRVTGALTVDGDFVLSTGNMYLATATQVNGSQLPLLNNTFDIGNATYAWRDLYLAGTIQSGIVPYARLSGVPGFATETYVNALNNLTYALISANIGNWTADKGSYATLTYVGGINNLSLSTISGNIGNWTLDKTGYSTTAQANALYASFTYVNAVNNVSLSTIQALIDANGNYSQDKSAIYTNITNLQNSGSGNYYVNVTTLQTSMASEVVNRTAQNGYANITNLQTSNTSAWININGAYTNISSLQSNSGLYYANISTAQNSINSLTANVSTLGNWSAEKAIYATLLYVNALNNLSLSSIASNIGNWTLDKSGYSTTSQANALYAPIALYGNVTNLQTSNTSAWINIGGAYTNITLLQASSNNYYTNISTAQNSINSLTANVSTLGNWSAEKANYATLIYVGGINNLSLSSIVSNIGNWTLDKTGYSTTAQANALYAPIALYGNVTNLQTSNTSAWINIGGAYTNITALQSGSSNYYANISGLQTSNTTTNGRITSLNTTKLNLAGGTMSGDIAMGTNGITGIGYLQSPASTNMRYILSNAGFNHTFEGGNVAIPAGNLTIGTNRSSYLINAVRNSTSLVNGLLLSNPGHNIAIDVVSNFNSYINFKNAGGTDEFIIQSDNAADMLRYYVGASEVASLNSTGFYALKLYGDGSSLSGIPTITYVNAINNLSRTTVDGLIAANGNWTLDKSGYSTTAQANALYAPIALYGNVTNLQTSNTSAWINIGGAYTNITALQSASNTYYTNISTAQTSINSLVVNVTAQNGYLNITNLQTDRTALNSTKFDKSGGNITGNFTAPGFNIYGNVTIGDSIGQILFGNGGGYSWNSTDSCIVSPANSTNSRNVLCVTKPTG